MVWHGLTSFFSQALAEALKVNTIVKSIDLSWNCIGTEGGEHGLHFVASHSDMSRWISAEKKVGSGFKDFWFSAVLGELGKISNLTNIFQKIRYCLILFNTCMEYFSSFTSCRLHPLSPTSVLLPSHVRDSWKIWPNSWTPVQQHWCLRSLQHQ